MDVLEFDKLAQDITTKVEADGYIICADDTQAVNELRDKVGNHIVFVLPSLYIEGAPDSLYTSDTTAIYVLTKDNSGQLKIEELKQFQDTQQIALKIVKYLCGDIENDYYCRLQKLDLSNTVLDPVYREFAGWNGYTFAISF